MPDDYYVSQYSGEEIDERLTAAHNAVRYDAAQTQVVHTAKHLHRGVGVGASVVYAGNNMTVYIGLEPQLVLAF